MAKQQQQAKSPVASSANATSNTQKAAPVRPAGTSSDSIFKEGKTDFIFGRTHFMYFGAGLLLVFLGLGLMTGGAQPSPDVWDESIIYSPVRITLAPMMILAGFVAVIIGIFKKA